ncbi:hypothetical protein [Nocardia asiatica]|uniref:hypothetical protein n=1 Tax=Nocardia asiatica TaxID=209252 RepID=UPI002457F452|nr:hypothetical protein [Nocardia asiatica]
MSIPRDQPEQVDPYQAPPQPIWRDDTRQWQRNIVDLHQACARLGGGAIAREPKASAYARAIATAVFYTASQWHESFQAPIETQINVWASAFEYGGVKEWLTIDLAVRAVHAHFRQSITGYMLPSHAIQAAALLKLEAGNY